MIIEASSDVLLQQASYTAETYFIEAIRAIDHQFGPGYAKDHPELVAAFMTVAGQDLTTSISLKVFEEAVAEVISDISIIVADAITRLNE